MTYIQNQVALRFSRELPEGREWKTALGPVISTAGISLEALNFVEGYFSQKNSEG